MVVSNKTILIIGVTSALGRFLVQSYRATYAASVTIIGTSRDNQIDVPGVDQRVTMALDDPSSIDAAVIWLTRTKIDQIVFCASAVPAAIANETEFFAVNVRGGCYLVQSLLARTTVCSFVYMSSSAVYSSNVPHLLENSPIATGSPYGFSKFLAESALRRLCIENNVNFLCLRLPVLLVPNVKNNFLASWRKKATNGESLSYSNATGLFNNIADGRVIYEACTLALSERARQCLTINIGCSDIVPVRHLVDLVLKFSPPGASAVAVPATKPAQTLDVARAKRLGLTLRSVCDSLEWFFNE